jgi:hypothetical protein
MTMNEAGKVAEPKMSKYEWTLSIPFLLVMAGIFAFYIFHGVRDAFVWMGRGKSALFFVMIGAAFCLRRLRDKEKRLYGGLAVIFGIGATWAEVAKFKLVPTANGLNIELAQIGPMFLAALFVADGVAVWRDWKAEGSRSVRQPDVAGP